MSAGRSRFRSAREWIETGDPAPYRVACRTAGAQGIFMAESWRPAGGMSFPALDELLLLIAKQGAGGVRARSAPDSLYLLAPGMPGSILVDAPHVIRTLALPHEVVRSTLAEAGREAIDFGRLHGGPFHDPFLISIAERLWEAGGEAGPEHRFFADSAAATLVARLLQLAAQAPPEARGGLSGYQLRRVRDYCETNLAAEIALGELAAIAGLSPYHFARAFKHSTSLSPHAWLTELRMARARELMTAQPAMPLAEVALCVGYASQTAFGAAFRRVTGATPGDWRRRRAP